MLKSIHIESLYDTYTYNLPIYSEKEAIRFITGPNGYGKTSILNILNYIYSQDFESLKNIRFKHVVLSFDDGRELNIEQELKRNIDEQSDESPKEEVTLRKSFLNTKDGKELSDAEISLYLSSHPIYYIRDGRMYLNSEKLKSEGYDEQMRVLFSEHSEDETFLRRLEAFKAIVSRSDFAHKTLETGKRFGFRFVADNKDHTILTFDKLSSGERHILIIAFELLFLASDDSLVLIDEPEMSFHPMWQIDFIKNLRDIMNNRELQCIVSTHAPLIFEMNWDLTIDLYEQSKTIND